MKKQILTLVMALLLSSQSSAFALAATSFSPHLSTRNAIAGEELQLQAGNLIPDAKVYFYLQKPDGAQLTVLSMASADGVAKAKIYDYHTKMTGKYCANMQYAGSNTLLSQQSCFDVLPSAVSADRSLLKIAEESSLFSEKVTVNVLLNDDFGNPVQGHSVLLIPSDDEVLVNVKGEATDEDGLISFDVISKKDQLVTFMAYDQDEKVLLKSRVEVMFEQSDLMASNSTKLLKTAHAQDSGPLAAFEIEDLPEDVIAGKKISLTVTAKDAEGNTVENYTGTIRFSVEGDNASAVTLPIDYKFEAEDLGAHEFALVVSFDEAGAYKIIVNDVSDKYKVGEADVEVVEEESLSGSTNSSLNASVVVLTSPASGTYSQPVQIISGSAKIGATISIYDGKKIIGTTVAGAAGKFIFNTPALSDGKHEISVKVIDAITKKDLGTSESVEITIDTSVAQIDEIKLQPEKNIEAGDVVTVSIYSEANLNQAIVTFNNEVSELSVSEEDETLYEGEIQVPEKAGDYQVDVILVDELGNEVTYENQATLTVNASGKGSVEVPEAIVEEKPIVEESTDPKQGLPTQVKALKAYGSDNRITLNWEAASDDGKIDHYRVYYGMTLDGMSNVIETYDASPTWYVPDLQNGKEYFFAVSAIDDEGNESALKSNIVSGIPFIIELNELDTEAPDSTLEENAQDLKPAAVESDALNDAKDISDSGPGLGLVLIGSLCAGAFLKRKKVRV